MFPKLPICLDRTPKRRTISLGQDDKSCLETDEQRPNLEIEMTSCIRTISKTATQSRLVRMTTVCLVAAGLVYVVPVIAQSDGTRGTGIGLSADTQNTANRAAASQQAGKNSATESSPVLAVTSASKTFNGAFSQQYGQIKTLEVRRGDSVSAGQSLVLLDTSVERAQYDYFMLQADTSLQTAAAQQEFQMATVRFERFKSIFELGGGNKFEVEEAQADAAVRRITVDIRKREGDIAAAQARGQQARIDQMQIKSPIAGVVSMIHYKEGEIVDQNRPVIEVVQLNPLFIELRDIQHATVSQLKTGQTVQVRYSVSSGVKGISVESAWNEAKINFISPLVDEATGYRLIRLEMPNPDLEPAGLEVEVKLPTVIVLK